MKRQWAVFQAKGLDEDYVQHVAYYLLTKPEAKTLNLEQLRYATDRFTMQAYRPKDEHHTNYSHNFRPQPQLDQCTRKRREDLLSSAIRYVTESANQEVQVLIHEIAAHLGAHELTLFAMGQIDAGDLALLFARNKDEVVDLALHFEQMRPWLARWVHQYATS